MLEKGNLDDFNARSLMQRWLNDEISDVQTGAFLSALRSRDAQVLNYALWLRNY